MQVELSACNLLLPCPGVPDALAVGVCWPLDWPDLMTRVRPGLISRKSPAFSLNSMRLPCINTDIPLEELTLIKVIANKSQEQVQKNYFYHQLSEIPSESENMHSLIPTHIHIYTLTPTYMKIQTALTLENRMVSGTCACFSAGCDTGRGLSTCCGAVLMFAAVFAVDAGCSAPEPEGIGAPSNGSA